MLTVSSLLDARKVTPHTKIVVPPELPVQDRVIHDYFQHGRIHLTLTGVIAKSSNIGTVLAASQFKPQQLYDYLRSFGLGKRTDIGVHGESSGVLNDWQRLGADQPGHHRLRSGRLGERRADGRGGQRGRQRRRLRLTQPDQGSRDHVRWHRGRLRRQPQHRVVSKRAAILMTRMMEAVTNPETGTAGMAGIPGYRVAGKTGTAQRVGSKCHCYNGTFTASFAGFAPADKPRFLVYIVIQDPKNGGGGGSIGGPAFHKIMSYLLQRYAVPPTGTKPPVPRIEW